jgi:hypothetical protein
MASRESERFIVLGGRDSRPHGEGTAKPSQPAKETAPGSRPDMLLPTSLREIARKAKRSKSYRKPTERSKTQRQAPHRAESLAPCWRTSTCTMPWKIQIDFSGREIGSASVHPIPEAGVEAILFPGL